jgi:hypothetical protein
MAKSMDISLKKMLFIKHVIAVYILYVEKKRHKLLIGYQWFGKTKVYWIDFMKRYPFYTAKSSCIFNSLSSGW